MTVGARLRKQRRRAASRATGPRPGGRGRTEGDEEAAAILEHLESGAEAAESEGERPAPGVPGRGGGCTRRPPRALRAAGGAGAGRKAQEEVPEEAEEVRQGRHSTATSALGGIRRLPES